jgi:hypothetical protein
MVDIDLDFIRDVRDSLEAELVRLGYPAATNATGDKYKDAHQVCLDHFNAFARRISQRPRTVHWSPDLKAREPTLAADVRTGLAAAISELQAGTDVRPRLSRGLKERDYDDRMLNDWGIHHMHLGSKLESDGFIERTGPVLFVMVRPDDVYLLDVRGHGAWTDADLVEIVHLNWPETIKPFRLLGVAGDELTKQQRKNLRAKSANAGVTMKDGTVYAAIGGGLVASAANFNAVRWGDMLLVTAMELEKAVRALDHEKMLDDVEQKTGTRPDQLNYRLVETHDDHAFVSVDNAAALFIIRVNYGGK